MSEYQYYEFVAIDRPISRQQQAELRNLSTRARPGPGQLREQRPCSIT
jgi:hypothetical protein